MSVIIYTDGGADPNPGIGGWAAILTAGEREKVLTGSEPQTTNNRMELTAAIEALRALKRDSEVVLYTDSEYLRRGITEWIDGWAAKGWKKVKNVDLWQTLWALSQQHQIDWQWVRGHTGNPLNERVDQLAREARLAITPEALVSADSPHLFLRASCIKNPGPGGWAVVYQHGDAQDTLSGSAAHTTNNRMELTAALHALSLLPHESAAYLLTMSDYVFQGATRWIHGWRKRGWQKRSGDPIANADLWQQLDAALRNYAVRWINGKGSDAAPFEAAAKLASAAAVEAAEGQGG
jgi:ribonuclease HI